MRKTIRQHADEMGIAGAVALALLAVVLTLTVSFGVPEAVDQVTPDSPAYPPDLVDHGGRGPDDVRGATVGAASSVSPRPTHLGTKYGYYQSPNWSPRGFNIVEGIVVHVTGPGTMAGMRSWFANPTAGASAQFGIGKQGELDQYVDVGDGAWHAGIVNAPDRSNALIASWLAAGVNPNSRTVGIELLLTPGENLADYPAMRATLHDLLAWLSETLFIPLDRTHVIGHYQIDAVNRSVDPRCCVDIDLELSIVAGNVEAASCPSGVFNPEGFEWDPCLDPYGRWENAENGYGNDPAFNDWYLWGVKEWAPCEWWGGRRNYRNGDFLPAGHSIFIDEGSYWSTAPSC